MSQPVTLALVGIIGMLIGALIGNRLAWDRDDRISRAAFVGRLCELKALAGKIEDENFPVWFAKAQVAVEKECGLVQGAIYWHRRKRFAAARKQCSQPQTHNDIADPELAFSPIKTYQRGRMEFSDALDKLIACAS